MAQKKSYSRYFIILQEDANGYSLSSDKLPSGYTKLETKNDKCKVSYYVQNLRKEKEPYYMVLICNKKDSKKLVKIGPMNIDEFGRSEVTFEYDVNNVAGSNLNVDLIGGAAIVKLVDANIVSIMSGFTSTEPPKDWKGFTLVEGARDSVEKEEKPEVAHVSEEVRKEVKEEEKISEKVKVKEEAKQNKNIFDEYEQKIEEIKQADVVRDSSDQPQEAQVDVEAANPEQSEEDDSRDQVEEITENQEIDSREPASDPVVEYEDLTRSEERDYPTGTVGEFFKLLVEDFEEERDRCKEIKKCKWYKVPVNSLDNMCDATNYNKYTVVYYPMINYYPYIKKHGHYLVGYKYDTKGKMKYIVYGIPGRKHKMDQPYSGKSGFVTWVPNVLGDERDESYGYWLMFYDFRNSTIVIPVK